MPWLEVNKMEQRKVFVLRLLKGEKITDVCKEYEISRQTGYKFLNRFKQDGFKGLEDQSRRPHYSPRKISPFLEELIISTKAQYTTWGPKKIKARIESLYTNISVPAASTIGGVLSRHGLVDRKPRRISRGSLPSHLTNSSQPNEVWCVDFKGQFKTKDNKYCYPLTISDHMSRFLLSCDALEGTSQNTAYQTFKNCFVEYGIPKIIRSDNGSPFASNSAIYGLTRLSVWFLRLGISLERIDPGHPEQNGRHERMHRTLKKDVINPPAKNILQQQESFDRYLMIYNHERPHEALGMKTPGSVYAKSNKSYTEVSLGYPKHDFTKRVCDKGFLHLSTKIHVKISKAFVRQILGLKEFAKGWIVSFAEYDIGFIDKKTLTFECMEMLDT